MEKIIVSSLIAELKADQVRCGEHSDYGSITLLFQDGVGGLEVKLLIFFTDTKRSKVLFETLKYDY